MVFLHKCFFAFLLFPISFLLAQVPNSCPKEFQCPNLGNLSFPFTNISKPDCGLCLVDCNKKSQTLSRLYLRSSDQVFDVVRIFKNNSIKLIDTQLQTLLNNQNCNTFYHEINLPNSSSVSFWISSNTSTIFRCWNTTYLNQQTVNTFLGNGYIRNKSCDDSFQIFYRNPKSNNSSPIEYTPPGCSTIHLPLRSWDSISTASQVFDLLSFEFDLQFQWGQPRNQNSRNNSRLKAIFIAIAAIVGVAFLNVLAIFLIWRCKKRIQNNRYVRHRADLLEEYGSEYLGIPIFSYSSLEEITNNFDASNELGDGGYGTVYYGKLRDGREVAVKRLYEHNLKRMEQQFMNEVRILTRLKHKNLVTLYGFTCGQSRNFLLVYEYIPNGTVADHLHGERWKHKSLTWPIRMNIAIETAGALAYLHSSDIIHRDVKTNNILLDHNFQVKVADFGLSKLFPDDVSHISTAPRGTPGYVDPEYHHCYQVTDKSDVYSFGVVLIELISSMPAVDITRNKHEINLAELAINRIQKRALHDLIDPSLGFETDFEVLRMTTSVAELAFQCLQFEKEMRPTMSEILENLKEIRDWKEIYEKTTETNANNCSPESENLVLLKSGISFPCSTKSVTDLSFSSSKSSNSGSRENGGKYSSSTLELSTRIGHKLFLLS